MEYTQEMETSEILLQLAAMRTDLLKMVGIIEKIAKNIDYKARVEQTERGKSTDCQWK